MISQKIAFVQGKPIINKKVADCCLTFRWANNNLQASIFPANSNPINTTLRDGKILQSAKIAIRFYQMKKLATILQQLSQSYTIPRLYLRQEISVVHLRSQMYLCYLSKLAELIFKIPKIYFQQLELRNEETMNVMFKKQWKITTQISFYGCLVMDSGFKHFAKHSWPCLQILRLEGNFITEKGIKMMVKCDLPNLILFSLVNKSQYMENPNLKCLVRCHWPRLVYFKYAVNFDEEQIKCISFGYWYGIQNLILKGKIISKKLVKKQKEIIQKHLMRTLVQKNHSLPTTVLAQLNKK